MWLRNCWYVIAWDHEIPAAGSRDLFTRTVLGEPILVFRREDGALAALEDRCCHRSAPLSKGRREGDCVRCGYHGKMRSFDSALDRWFIYDFLLPGTLLMHSGGRPVGDAPDDPGNAVRLHSCQTLTPETATTTHCFFQQSHPAGQGDASLTEGIYASLVAAFNEDRDIITAQHRNLLLRPDAPMLPLAMDSALIQFRRLLAERVRAEGAVAAAPAPRTGTLDPALS